MLPEELRSLPQDACSSHHVCSSEFLAVRCPFSSILDNLSIRRPFPKGIVSRRRYHITVYSTRSPPPSQLLLVCLSFRP